MIELMMSEIIAAQIVIKSDHLLGNSYTAEPGRIWSPVNSSYSRLKV